MAVTKFVAIETTNPRYTVGDQRLTLRYVPPAYDHAPALRLGVEKGGDDSESCWLTNDGMRKLRDALSEFIEATT